MSSRRPPSGSRDSNHPRESDQKSIRQEPEYPSIAQCIYENLYQGGPSKRTLVDSDPMDETRSAKRVPEPVYSPVIQSPEQLDAVSSPQDEWVADDDTASESSNSNGYTGRESESDGDALSSPAPRQSPIQSPIASPMYLMYNASPMVLTPSHYEIHTPGVPSPSPSPEPIQTLSSDEIHTPGVPSLSPEWIQVLPTNNERSNDGSMAMEIFVSEHSTRLPNPSNQWPGSSRGSSESAHHTDIRLTSRVDGGLRGDDAMVDTLPSDSDGVSSSSSVYRSDTTHATDSKKKGAKSTYWTGVEHAEIKSGSMSTVKPLTRAPSEPPGLVPSFTSIPERTKEGETQSTITLFRQHFLAHVEQNNGHFDRETGELKMELWDASVARRLYRNLGLAFFVKRLSLVMHWAWTEEDLKDLAEVVKGSNITALFLDGMGCRTENKTFASRGRYGLGYTTPSVPGSRVNTVVTGVGTRFDPLILLLGHQGLKRVHIQGMPEFLKEFSVALPEDLSHLEVLQVPLRIVCWVDIHATRFHQLLSRCTRVRRFAFECPPNRYRGYLEYTQRALAGMGSQGLDSVEVQQVSMGHTHVIAQFQRGRMTKMSVNMFGSRFYDLVWTPILKSKNLVEHLVELRLDFVIDDSWVEPVVQFLDEIVYTNSASAIDNENSVQRATASSRYGGRLRELYLHWPSIGTMPLHPQMYRLVGLAAKPESGLTKSCVRDLQEGLRALSLRQNEFLARTRTRSDDIY
ncbi:hypothetical protein BGZ94_009144 [Podila epigama]|nr:hypothetical protein BGZ94_009144 [Podila epigama]